MVELEPFLQHQMMCAGIRPATDDVCWHQKRRCTEVLGHHVQRYCLLWSKIPTQNRTFQYMTLYETSIPVNPMTLLVKSFIMYIQNLEAETAILGTFIG